MELPKGVKLSGFKNFGKHLRDNEVMAADFQRVMESKNQKLIEAEFNFTASKNVSAQNSAKRLNPAVSDAIMSIYDGNHTGSAKKTHEEGEVSAGLVHPVG